MIRRTPYCGLGMNSESSFSFGLLTFMVLFELAESLCWFSFSYFISAHPNASCFWLMSQHILCCIFHHFLLDVAWLSSVHGNKNGKSNEGMCTDNLQGLCISSMRSEEIKLNRKTKLCLTLPGFAQRVLQSWMTHCSRG